MLRFHSKAFAGSLGVLYLFTLFERCQHTIKKPTRDEQQGIWRKSCIQKISTLLHTHASNSAWLQQPINIQMFYVPYLWSCNNPPCLSWVGTNSWSSTRTPSPAEGEEWGLGSVRTPCFYLARAAHLQEVTGTRYTIPLTFYLHLKTYGVGFTKTTTALNLEMAQVPEARLSLCWRQTF